MKNKTTNAYLQNFKRPLDVIGAAIGLVMTLPLTLPVAAILAVRNNGHVFHTEQRIGKDGKPFEIYKFKTIYSKNSMQQDARRSPFALALRAHSIDELPQLVNIIKGDMSLVGPRPLRGGELSLDEDSQTNCPWVSKYVESRQMVRPGLACFYEVKREEKKFMKCEWDERFISDHLYSKKASPMSDLWIGFHALKHSILGRNSANLPLTDDRYLNNYCQNHRPPIAHDTYTRRLIAS